MRNRPRSVVVHWLCYVALAAGMLTGLSASVAADDKKPTKDKTLFDPTRICKVTINLTAKEYAALQPRGGWGGAQKPEAAAKGEPARELHRNAFGVDLPWATGSITLDGQTFTGVGIRYKGNGTIGDAASTIKKSFKIDLDHFGGTGRFQGLKTINLHCGVTDPSKCRESLGYALYRAAGVPAPRTTLAEVYLTVPGKYDKELLGLYTLVEPVDKAFLMAHFKTDEGLLMKPEGLRDFQHQGDDWERYKKNYAPKRDATKSEAQRIIAFARLVHKADDAEFQKEIASYLEVDAYLRFLATTAFVANADSFFALGHNYYLYLHPKTRRLTFIPWDLDRAFANFPMLGSNTRQLDMSLQHPYAGPHRLTDRLLAIPEMQERYQKLLAELAATCFTKEKLQKELATLEAATKDLLARDLAASAARKEVITYMFGRPPALKTFVEKRTASVATQIAGKSKGYIPTSGFGPGGFKLGDMLAGPMLEDLDTDKDEQLSREEWVAAARKVFAACTADGQGRLNEKALADGLNGMFPKPAGGPPGGFGPGAFMAGPVVKRADADKDGGVTLPELVAAAEKIFDDFDKGKAGKLDEAAFSELLNTLFPPPRFGPPDAKPPEPKKEDKKEEKKEAKKP